LSARQEADDGGDHRSGQRTGPPFPTPPNEHYQTQPEARLESQQPRPQTPIADEWGRNIPRQSSYDRSLQEKEAAELEMQQLLEQQQEAAHQAEQLHLEQIQQLAQATREAELAEQAVRESQSRVQMLEARQAATTSPTVQSPAIPQSKVFEDHSSMVEDLRRRRLREEQRATSTTRSETPEERSTRLDEMRADRVRTKRQRLAKSKKPVKAPRQRLKPVQEVQHEGVREPRSKSTLTKAFTTGEKDQFLNQMAKHAAELLFFQKQSPGKHPLGIDAMKTAVRLDGGKMSTEMRNTDMSLQKNPAFAESLIPLTGPRMANAIIGSTIDVSESMNCKS
jgi:hypothetical protein